MARGSNGRTGERRLSQGKYMPKRISNKFELVVTDENCIEGVREMLKGKKRRAKYAGILTPDKKKIMRIIMARVKRRERHNAVAYYREHVEEIGRRIAHELRTGTWTPQPYRERMIFDNLRGKWRRLRVPCLYDQCVHHAVMRQTVPDIMARKYFYDCGSVPNAGQARAVDALNRAMSRKKPPKYAASMDVKHFYDTCTADAVMTVLRRVYKDRRFLALHEQILSSMGGVLAIGFYPSPWYGNLLLSFAVDRELKQNCKGIAFYCRYADDMVILGNSKRALHRAVRTIMARLAGLPDAARRGLFVLSLFPALHAGTENATLQGQRLRAVRSPHIFAPRCHGHGELQGHFEALQQLHHPQRADRPLHQLQEMQEDDTLCLDRMPNLHRSRRGIVWPRCLDANIPDDAKEVPAAERWRAACYVTTMPDRPGILARIEANLDAWHDAVVDEATRTEAWRARCERDDLLAKCDYTMGTDYPATDAERDAWRTYRQALRDIPEQEGFPWDIAWPEPPKREKGEDTILGAIDELIGGGDE